MDWTYNSILDNAEFKAELDKFNDIQNEIKILKDETIPNLNYLAEHRKVQSLKDDLISWQDVEQARHDIEKEKYRLETLKKERQEQNKLVSEKRQEAREEILKEAEQKKLESLQKSVQAYQLYMEAYNDIRVIDAYQVKALNYSKNDLENEYGKRGKIASLSVRIPHPIKERPLWDMWLKSATSHLKSKGIS